MELFMFVSIVINLMFTLPSSPGEELENPLEVAENLAEELHMFPRRILKKGEGEGGEGGGSNGSNGGTANGKESFLSVNRMYYEAKLKYENRTKLPETLKPPDQVDAINGSSVTNNTTPKSNDTKPVSVPDMPLTTPTSKSNDTQPVTVPAIPPATSAPKLNDTKPIPPTTSAPNITET